MWLLLTCWSSAWCNKCIRIYHTNPKCDGTWEINIAFRININRIYSLHFLCMSRRCQKTQAIHLGRMHTDALHAWLYSDTINGKLLLYCRSIEMITITFRMIEQLWQITQSSYTSRKSFVLIFFCVRNSCLHESYVSFCFSSNRTYVAHVVIEEPCEEGGVGRREVNFLKTFFWRNRFSELSLSDVKFTFFEKILLFANTPPPLLTTVVFHEAHILFKMVFIPCVLNILDWRLPHCFIYSHGYNSTRKDRYAANKIHFKVNKWLITSLFAAPIKPFIDNRVCLHYLIV